MSVDGEDSGADVHNGEDPLMDADFGDDSQFEDSVLKGDMQLNDADWGDENVGLEDTVTPKRQNDADKENDLPGEVVVSQVVVAKKAKRSQKIILESPLTTPTKPAKRKATTDANDDGTSAKAVLDNPAHSPLNVSKAQNPKGSSKSAPLPSLKLELPAICPANYCKDPVPSDPGNELALLFLEKQAFVAKHSKNAPGASQFTRRICENIKLENRRLECRREARVNAWPLEIDYSELPNRIEAFEDEIYQIAFDGPQLAECPIWQSFVEAISYKVHAFSLAEIGSFSPGADSAARCGYFGPRGKAVIMSTLENFIQDRLAPEQIYQTIACLHDTPEQWDEPDEDFTLMSDVQFLEYILAPFVAVSLIWDNFECDLVCAIEIMRASSEFGDLFHSDMLVPSPVPSPVKKIEPKPMISKPSSDVPPVEPPKQGPQAKNLESKSSTSVLHANMKTMAKSVTKTTMTSFPPPEIRKKHSEPKSQSSKKSKNIADTIAPHAYGTRSNAQR
ncbi:hypothetical protein MVEN_00045800 [Mycena venus]|uniref:Restriction of telomere capping protein 4 C-terminal domain-containing protein n=1 Tax=Mycena venus TaxID=2733690 RepID=A0A8H6Z9Z1_9AGAR|nr:hypothetical protein MVEN_00045800 [Mycena venus]